MFSLEKPHRVCIQEQECFRQCWSFCASFSVTIVNWSIASAHNWNEYRKAVEGLNILCLKSKPYATAYKARISHRQT